MQTIFSTLHRAGVRTIIEADILDRLAKVGEAGGTIVDLQTESRHPYGTIQAVLTRYEAEGLTENRGRKNQGQGGPNQWAITEAGRKILPYTPTP